MRDRNIILILCAPLGVLAGVLATYPYPIGIAATAALWSLVGLGIGVYLQNKDDALWPGALFGFSLCLAFFFSRFDWSSNDVLGYSLLVTALGIFAAAGGSTLVYVGAKLGKKLGW